MMDGAGGRLRSWQRALVFGWAALALVAMFERGRQTGVDLTVGNRLRYHAIPVAMSVLYQGRPHDYTAFWGLAIGFQDPGTIEDRIAWGVKYVRPTNENRTYYWAADDRGMADYVIGAFTLFGPRADSLYKFYFVVLGLSVLLFLLDLSWHPAMSATLIFALGALYTCLSVIPLGNLTLAIFEPGSLFEPRVIELLSLVAALHLGLTGFVSSRWSPARIAIIAGQSAILAACYHARSSVGWEVLFVVIVGGVSWAARRWLARGQSTGRLDLPWPVLCLAAAVALLVAYERHAYNPRYFQDMGARTVWHNALMGLGSNRHLASTYDLGVSDRAAVDSVIRFLRDRHDPRLTADWTRDNILNSLGGHSVFNWFVYEQSARDLYWHLWRTETRSMLHLYLIDRPREIGQVIVKAALPDAAPWRNRQGLFFNPFAAGALMVTLPGLLIAGIRRPDLKAVVAAALVLLACSVIPGVLFYPVVHTMMGVFASLSLVAYLTVAMTVAAACRLGSRKLRGYEQSAA